MTRTKFCWNRLTKCDSGLPLNPLMYIFMLLTLAFSVFFTFFGHTTSVSESVLYIQTLEAGQSFVNVWGIIGLVVVAFHFIGLLIRGNIGIQLMRVCIFGGFYLWLWAGIVYLQDNYYFQFTAVAVPNLLFWSWYAWQWRRRQQGRFIAFV